MILKLIVNLILKLFSVDSLYYKFLEYFDRGKMQSLFNVSLYNGFFKYSCIEYLLYGHDLKTNVVSNIIFYFISIIIRLNDNKEEQTIFWADLYTSCFLIYFEQS